MINDCSENHRLWNSYLQPVFPKEISLAVYNVLYETVIYLIGYM